MSGLIPPFQPQFTFPPAIISSSKHRRAAFRSRPELAAPRPALPRVHASCERREQKAAVPKQSLERGSTPTQERETVATAGVGPRRGIGGG